MSEQLKQVNKCQLCGEPMPAGEEMFKYHGYSGDCPKPPMPRDDSDVTGQPGPLPETGWDEVPADALKRALTTSQPAQVGEVDERVAAQALFEVWRRTEFAQRDDEFASPDLSKYAADYQQAWAEVAKQARASMPTQPAAQATPEPDTCRKRPRCGRADPCAWLEKQATQQAAGEPVGREFFAWDPEGGQAFYKTQQEAIDHAKESLKYYRDGANDHGEWDEDVEQVRWGVVMQRAKATNISATEDGESSCDYELQDVAAHPAPAVPEGWTVSAYKAAGLTIQSMAQLNGPDRWKIADASGNVLNKQGEWEWEPSPSNRDDAFLARCRYATLAEASAALAASQAKGG